MSSSHNKTAKQGCGDICIVRIERIYKDEEFGKAYQLSNRKVVGYDQLQTILGATSAYRLQVGDMLTWNTKTKQVESSANQRQ